MSGGRTISGFSFLSARSRRASVRTGVHRIRAGSVRYAFLSKAGICVLQFEARTRAAGHTESRLLLCNKNSPVLPTSTLRKSQKNQLQQHLTFRPPFQRRQNPKTASLVAPRTERNSFPCKSAGGETKQSGGLFWRGEPSPGVPRCALAHNKSRLFLGTETSLVLPKSATITL